MTKHMYWWSRGLSRHMSQCKMDSDDELIRASQEMEVDAEIDGFVSSVDNEDELIRASQETEAEADIDGFVSSLDNEDKRFFVASEEDILQRADYAMPENTRRRDKWASNVFTAWAVARNNRHNEKQKVLKKLENMSDDELAFFLPIFVVEVRKQNGEEYPPNSVFQLVMGIQSFLKSTAQKDVKFLQSDKFVGFRQVLDGEMKRLTHKGLGATKKQAEVITEEEEELLWKSGQLGNRNPRVLLNTILFLNGKNFSLRSGVEHRKLRFKNSQITLKTSNGKEHLNYHEDYSKAMQGGLKHRKINPKDVNHFGSSNPNRCHVSLYKQYISLCPPDGHDDAFYLQVLRSPSDTCWYSRQPLGHNTLQKIVPQMCAKAGVQGYKTNHSLRATTATRLYSAGISEQLIMERTGHRSVEGIRSYTRTSHDQQNMVSDILNECKVDTSDSKVDTSDSKVDITDRKSTGNQVAEAVAVPASLRFDHCVVHVTLK